MLFNFDVRLTSFAMVLTICTDNGETFTVQLIAFKSFPSQYKHLFKDSRFIVFCYDRNFIYLMIQHLFGGKTMARGSWKMVDHCEFVAGMMKVSNLTLIYKEVMEEPLKWFFIMEASPYVYEFPGGSLDQLSYTAFRVS